MLLDILEDKEGSVGWKIQEWELLGRRKISQESRKIPGAKTIYLKLAAGAYAIW